MRKILFLLLAGSLLFGTSCSPSKGQLQQVAEESLRQSLYHPDELRILAVAEPDSAFGLSYFSKSEVNGILRTLKAVTDTIMARTDNMSRFDPDDGYTISLADRQMRATAEVRDLLFRSAHRGDFSGWKVRIDYEAADHGGQRYRSERWAFIDKDGNNVLRSFDIPLP